MQHESLVEQAHLQLRIAGEVDSGRSSKTLYGGTGHLLRQTVVALVEGNALNEHANPGEATVYVVLGTVRLTSADGTALGVQGDLLVVPDGPHSLDALEDAVILLTVLKY
jgi:quercetin dioxygenase-like cupin family protein